MSEHHISEKEVLRWTITKKKIIRIRKSSSRQKRADANVRMRLTRKT